MAFFPRLSTTSLLVVAMFSFVVHGVTPFAPERLFARDLRCIQDCPTTAPPCHCASDERCELVAQNCVECSKMICKQLATSPSSISVGTICGATLGGIALAGILGFVVYKVCSKRRPPRHSIAAASAAEKDDNFGSIKSVRASTHTVASIASTVRTRASNVIQIAYIPGVTNRSVPSTPTQMIPPVPPLPCPDSPVGSQYPRGDIQFAADDLLRASLCTVDNRSSIATTIYGGNAVVSQPNIVRAGKAAVVTVKSGNHSGTSNSPSPQSENIPPIPTLAKVPAIAAEGNPPPSPAFSIGSKFMAGVNSRKSSDPDIRDTANSADDSKSTDAKMDQPTSTLNYDSDDSDDFEPGHRREKGISQSSSSSTDAEASSPFTDANSVAVSPAKSSGPPPTAGNRMLSSKKAGPRASRRAELPQILERNVSPFDDSNIIEKRSTKDLQKP